jgi:hypothetical protein
MLPLLYSLISPKHLSHTLQLGTLLSLASCRFLLNLHILLLHSTPLSLVIPSINLSSLMYRNTSNPLQQLQHQNPLRTFTARSHNPLNSCIYLLTPHIRQREQNISSR